jgi:hypothetical protein
MPHSNTCGFRGKLVPEDVNNAITGHSNAKLDGSRGRTQSRTSRLRLNYCLNEWGLSMESFFAAKRIASTALLSHRGKEQVKLRRALLFSLGQHSNL